MIDNPFTRHPTEIGEGYFRHLASAGKFGLQLLAGALGCLVHAIFPFLFVNTASKTIDALHHHLKRRADAPNWERHPII
jgi:hypothetical protein